MTDTRNYPPRYHKRIRLDLHNYRNLSAICSVVIAVRERTEIFAKPALASDAIDVLSTLSEQLEAPVYAYCVMPDHVHLLIGPSESCDIIAFVAQFKNLVQRRAWQHGIQGRIWQTSFWDHFLRTQEDVKRAAEYILNNPVRAGLATQWDQYLFSGSFVFQLNEEAGDKPPTLRGQDGHGRS